MYPQHLKYLAEKNLAWFDPCNGLFGFWDEYRKLKVKLNQSHEIIWRHRELKRAKEIFAISILAKAMSKSDNLRWWIIKPDVDPPDGVIGTIINKNGLDEMHVREVEVVECLGGDVAETVINKLRNKNYEPNTFLVCLVSQGGLYNFETVANSLMNVATSLEHIFFVFTGFELSNIASNASTDELLATATSVTSVQVKPIYSVVSINPFEECKDWRTGVTGNYFIYEGRGRGGSKKITLEKPPTLF